MLVFLLSSPLPIAKHYRAKKEETKKSVLILLCSTPFLVVVPLLLIFYELIPRFAGRISASLEAALHLSILA